MALPGRVHLPQAVAPEDRLREFRVGWYQLGRSADVPKGKVKTVRFFDRDFVVYRGQDSVLRITDPYCPHLGTHLGENGEVSGNRLVCAFHRWEFGEGGACQKIPYAEKIPGAARIRHWTVFEGHTCFYIYFDPSGKPPPYLVPDIPEERDPTWGKAFGYQKTAVCSPMDIFENLVDQPHFKHIHNVTAPRVEVEESPFEFKLVIRGFWNNFGSRIKTEIRAAVWGPGVSLARINAGPRYRYTSFVNCTPVDQERSTVFVTNLISSEGIPRVLRPLVKRFVNFRHAGELQDDFRILSTRRTPKKPVLASGDGPIHKYRKWFFSHPKAEG